MNSVLKEVFQGHFLFERVISSPSVCFSGSAYFERTTAQQIAYSEQGCYQLPGGGGQKLACHQRRFFRFEASRLFIYKSDQSVLHEFCLDVESGKMKFPMHLAHKHLCARDQYHLRLTIDSLDRFSTCYVVQGPFKNYTIDTVFGRVVGVCGPTGHSSPIKI